MEVEVELSPVLPLAPAAPAFPRRIARPRKNVDA